MYFSLFTQLTDSLGISIAAILQPRLLSVWAILNFALFNVFHCYC